MDTFTGNGEAGSVGDGMDRTGAAPATSSAASDETSFQVTALAGGRHEVVIAYSNGWTDTRTMTLTLPDGRSTPVDFASTGSWAETGHAFVETWLGAGTTKLVFSGPKHTAPMLRELKVGLLTGDVAEKSDADETLVLVQNVAAIAALDALTRMSTAAAAGRASPSGEDGTVETGEGKSVEVASLDAQMAEPAMAETGVDGAVGSGSPQTDGMGPATGSGGAGGGSGAGGGESGRIEVDLDTITPASAGPVSQRSIANFAAFTAPVGSSERAFEAPEAGFAPQEEASDDLGDDASAGEEEATPPSVIDEEVTAEVPAPQAIDIDEPQAVAPAASTILRLQAEDAVLGVNPGGTVTTSPTVVRAGSAETDEANALAADGDAYVDFAGLPGDNNAGSGQYLQWNVTMAEAGYYDIDVGYAFNAANANRSMRMDVNGQLWDRIFDMRSTGANTTYSEATTRIFLNAGDNSIRLTSNGFSGPNVDYLDVKAADPNHFVFQAEAFAAPATISTALTENRAITPVFLNSKNAGTTGTNENFRVGAEGEAFLDWGGADAFADVTFTTLTAGTYTVAITYANGDGGNLGRPLELVNMANGQQIGGFAFAATNSFAPVRMPTDVSDIDATPGNASQSNDANTPAAPSGWEAWRTETITVTLAAGQTTLRLTSLGSQTTGPNIDKVEVKLLEPAAPAAVAPTDIAVNDLLVAENAAGATVGVVVVTDADSSSHTFEVREGAEISTRFEVVDNQLRLKAGVTLDFESTRTYSLTITATDAQGGAVTRSFTVAVTDDTSDNTPSNTAPVFTVAPALASVDENITGPVASFTATDAESAVTYSLTGADADLFTISSDGVVTFNTAPNFEAPASIDNVYDLVVNASDGALNTATSLTVTVADVNEAPTLVGAFAAQTVSSAGGTISLDGLTASDEDQGDVATFGVRAAQGDLPAGISIVDGALVVAGGVAPGTYALQLFASDGTLDSNSVSFALTVEAPIVDEPEPFAQIVLQAEAGALTIVDTDTNTNDTVIRDPSNRETTQGLPNGLRPNFSGTGYLDFGDTPGDKATYTFTVTEAGSYDLNIRYASNTARPLAFSLDGAAATNLPLGATGTTTAGATEGFNNWALQKTTLTLSAGSHTISLAIPAGAVGGPNLDAIAITEAGVAPSFFVPLFTSGATASVVEGSTTALDVNASDGDGTSLTYSLTGAGADDALFQIDPATGVLTFNTAPDFEAPGDAGADNVYAVEIAVSDGSSMVTQSVSVTVTNDPADDDLPPVENAAPVITSTAAFTAAENSTAVGAIVATDGDDDSLTYALSGVDAGKLAIDANGVVTLVAAPNFETPADANGDSIYEATVTVSDGAVSTTQAITVAVANVNEAPTSIALSGNLSLAETAATGALVGTLTAVDPDASDTVSFTVDDPRFTVTSSGQLVVASGASFEFETEPTVAVTVTAADAAGLQTQQVFTLSVENPPEPVGPLTLAFNASLLTSYSSQDGAGAASVSEGGETLSLNGNLWKRASLGESYVITENTKLTLTLTIGSNLSEIVAVGFDDDNSPFEMSDRSVYQLAGSETQAAFVDLRAGSNGTPGETRTVTIDLSAHAGKTISSLVFIADDDFSGNGIGSVSFSDVELGEGAVGPDENTAPSVVGGGIADLILPERGNLEIDMPFVDADGDPLSYTLSVTDANGASVAGFENLVFNQGTLSGQLLAAPSLTPYTVTITANDGQGGTAVTSFELTIEDVNDAPTLVAGVAFEPVFAQVGQEISGIDLAMFADAFTDPDGDALTLSVEGLPAGLSLNSEGVVVGTPLEAGDGTITIVATDPSGLTTALEFELIIEGPAVGDVTVVEAEAFTGLGEATGFYAAAAPGASGNQAIRTNANQSGAVSTVLGENGVTEGWYQVSVTVFDETDGTSTFTLKIGDTILAENVSFDTNGSFDNPGQPRGNGGQVGNLKTISFTTPVFIDAATIATITGRADSGEFLRIDKLSLTRTEAPDLAPSVVTIDTASVLENAAGAVIGTLSATDPDGSASGLVYSTTDARFVIVGDELRLASGVSLDHEAGATVAVSVKATDAQGLSTVTELTLSVGDVDEAPVLTAGATIADVALAAGEAQTIDLATALGATDPEGAAVSYVATLAGGAALPSGITLAGGSLLLGETLATGTYEIVVFATDGDLDSQSVSFIVTVGDEPPVEVFEPIVIQAETGTIALIGDTVTTDDDTKVRDAANPESNPDLVNGLRPGFTGTGYMDFGNDAGDVVTYTVTVAEAGSYDLNIRYASQAFNGAPRSLALGVNGTSLGTTVFADTGPASGPVALQGFNVWQFLTQSVTLNAGVNTITFAIPAGAVAGPNLDRIEITRPDTVPEDVSADADDIPLFLSGPDGELNETEAASINFQLAGIDADIVKTEISFDGGLTRAVVGPDADGDFVADGTALAPGSYTATVYVTDEVGNEASSSMSIVVGDAIVGAPPFTIQAEDATKVSVQDTGVATSAAFTRVVDAANPDSSGAYRAGSIGGAYMDFGGNAGDAITINVDAPAAGTYLVTFRYANGGVADRPLDLSLNGAASSPVSFAPGVITGTGATATAWEDWKEQTVELTLSAGSNAIKLAIPAGAVAGPNIDQITFAYQGDEGPVDPVEPFLLTLEGETFTPIDTTGTGNQITQARTPTNQEPNLPLATDVNSDGLWDGFTGTGYLDMGAQIGDAASFAVTAPDAGTYTFTFRFSNGGGAPNGDRPMTLSVNGEVTTVSFPGTGVNGWDQWQTATVKVDLAAGANTVTIANTVANGPNIDNVTISRDGVDPVDPREQIRFEEVVKINFEPAPGQTTQGLPAGYVTPAGYVADIGAAFGVRSNGMSYGWVTEASVADGTANGTTAAAQPANAHWYKNTVPGASDLQKTYAHFEFPGAGAGGSRAWEMALANGTYQVTMSVGDTAGAFDSNYNINVEGQSFLPDWTPANPIDGSQNGGGFRSTLVTGTVTVTDGRLTVDSIGGSNTEIQYLEVERVPDITPGDGVTADQDFSTFVAPVAASIDGQTSIAIGADGTLPTGIDPTAFLVVGINIQADGNRGPNIDYVDGIKLVETLTGIEAAIDVQISGGADSLTIRPLQQLKENTSYTLKVQDVLDLGSSADPDGPLRQFQDLTTTFVTGEAPELVAREVAFSTQTLLDGFVDGAGGYTSIEFGPDGKLYVATITGEIHRWTVNSNGSIDKASQETVSLDYLEAPGGERRGIVGFAFDPEDPNTIWITDNAPIPREQKAFDTPEFSGRVSKVTLGEGGSLEDATAETYIAGLPRSGADHLTNSLEFRLNPNAGSAGEPEYLLYLSQGSNSAGGAPDGAWGFRPERLLNAAILEIDPRKDAPQGGYDVQTEPLLNNNPQTQNPASSFNQDGTYSGFYNPYAEDAVLKVFAGGVRNAYDLVWHSNGNLYVPTNGTASGGKTPQDPTQTNLDTTINNSPKQYDYFFTVEEGKYYGHPNVLRDNYILNGGNPTTGRDPNEVVGGNDGNSSTDGYASGTKTDPNYDLDGVYNLGYNRSPNGATEYTGNAFGSNLKGAILFAQFSTGDNVRVIRVDGEGKIIGDDVLRRPDGSVIDDYIDPLDIIENPVTGQLYLMTLNRGTGASQLILLTPAPGGVTQDLTADEGNNLALVALDASDPAAAVFQINGLDDDITAVRVSFNGAAPITVTLDAQDRFTADLGTLTGPVTATIVVTDDALNTATAGATFTPGQVTEPTDLVSLLTIQAEDRIPGDGTSVTVATGATAQIQIRDASNPETTGGTGLVGGLRPGAFGTDGNTVNTDGTPGGYADFGSTNADFMTFTFSVDPDQAGAAVLRFRYANGDSPTAANGGARPLQVEVNGTIVTVNPFTPGAGATTEARLANWQTIDIPASLVAGANTVTLRAVNATGPNIDQLEILVPEGGETDPQAPNDGEVVVGGTTYVLYEAENADLSGAVVALETTPQTDRNASGAGYVDFTAGSDQSITWTVSVAQAGTYSVDFLYALGAGKAARPMSVSVDGAAVQTLPFSANSNAAETIWAPQSTTLTLTAGTHEITVTAPDAVGPNVDALRITKAPIAVFEPDYADINGTGRIEREATDGSANTVNGSTVDFYFTVASDGIYKLDVAAIAGAANGQGLTWFLNGVEVDESDFPGLGTAGEESVYLELEGGTDYQLRIVSDAPGANGLDYLDIQPAPGNANADIAVQSLDPAFLDNRLHFNFLENPDAVDPEAADRDYKDSGTVRISNTGTETLTFTDFELEGPFVLANPSVFGGLTLAAGAFVDVTVNFNRAAYTPPTTNVDVTSTLFEGALTLITNDADNPVTTIDLAGFWQSRDEGGQEPNVNEVWKIFGFGNVIEGLTTRGGGENSTLSTNDVFAKTDPTEVLSPYWKIADGVTEAKITHITAFHGTGGATMHLHNPGNKNSNVLLWNHEGTDNQRLLPNVGNDTTFATRSFGNGLIPDAWAGNEVFGISVAGLSTDPTLNPRGNVVVAGAQQGHTVKMFQALDADGNVIPNVYLGIMDYTGINYDYNDNMFVIEGVTPVGFGQQLAVSGLDAAAADERLVFTNIDDPANAAQAFRNEATFTITNPGFAALAINSLTLSDPAAFQIVGTPPTTIAAGGSATVTVRFTGVHSGEGAGADLFKSTLTITSNDLTQGSKVIQLAGLAQEFSENNSEPTVAQVVEAFGYTTDMAQGELAGGGVVETIGDEVLLPYLQKLDATKAVEVIQMAAFLQQNNVARLGFHGLGSSQVTNLFAQDDQQYQTVLPDQLLAGTGAGASVARGTINANTPFGLYISVDGRPTYASWSDPEANKIDPNFGQLVGENQGHLIRYFQALDANGDMIEGTFIGIQDYPGAGNYDYNDHMFVIKNVKAYDLTAANDANNDDVNDALQLDADNDGTVNFFDPNTTPPPGPQQPLGGTAPVARAAPLVIDATRFDTGGQGVAYNDTTATDQGGSAGRNEGVDVVGNNAAVGWIAAGEWIEYTINVERAGVHTLTFQAASPDAGRTITASFEQNGATYLTAPAASVVDTNNYTSFASTAPIQLNLAAGLQTVRLNFGGGAFDFDSFTLDRANVAPTVAQTLAPQAATQGQAFSYTLPAGLFADVDGDALTVSVTGLANGLTYNAATRVISGTPTSAGSLTLQVSASDGSASISTPLALTIGAGSGSTAQTPVSGTAPSFANGVLTVDASNYDNGGQGIAYNDAAGLQGGTNGGRAGSAVEATAAGDIGWIDPGDWTEYTINVQTAGAYDLDLLLANGGGAGRSVLVQFFKPGATTPYATSGTIANPSTGSFNTFANRGVDDIALDTGTQIVRVTFAGGSQDFRSFTLTAPANPQQPFGGTAPAFANGLLTVDASNYDTGGQGVAFNDNAGRDGGSSTFRPGDAVEFVGTQNDIGYVLPGEWIEYTVNVPTSGVYDLNLLAKTPLSNASVAVSLAGGATLATISLQDGGASFDAAPFQTSPSAGVTLPSGLQTIRLTFNGTPQAGSPYLLDLRSFSLDYREPPASGQTPFGGNHLVDDDLGLTLSAVQFDAGGQGVAFNDTTAAQLGSTTARPGTSVDVVSASNSIGWIADGEWVEYTVNVEEAGRYDLSFLAARGDASGTRSITASFEQNGAVYQTAAPVGIDFTGGWNTFEDSDAAGVQLRAGVQTVRLTFNGGAMDLQSFTLDPAPVPAARLAAFGAPIDPVAGDGFDDAGFDALVADAADMPDQPAEVNPLFHYDLAN